MVYATNDFHLSPTNLLISNLLQGSNIVVQYTNLGKIWLHGPPATDTNGLATTNYVQDATNTLKGDLLWLEQFGSANLTNWATLTTNTLTDQTNNSAFARTNIDNTFIGSNMFAGPLNGGTNVLIGPAYPLFANSGNALTVNSNTLLVTSNRVGISTNAPGCTLDINAPYGANVQFQVCTGGVPVLVVSNGYVGIRKGNPENPLDILGNVKINSGGLTADNDVSAGGTKKILWNGVTSGSSPVAGLYGWQSYSGVGNTYTNGAWQIFYGSTLNLSAADNTTNTLVYSTGTNLVVSDGIQANSTYGQFNQFTFSTSGTPVMVISNGMVGIGKANPTDVLDVKGGFILSGALTGGGDIRAGSSSRFYWQNNSQIKSPAPSYITFFEANLSTNGAALIFPASTNVLSTQEANTNTVIGSQGTNLVISDSISPIGGVVYQGKQSFYTNYTIATNDLQIFNCNGTGQVVTLPNAGSYPWNIFRFSSTNGYGNFTLTNATGAQTIRDGTNLFLKQIGVGEISLYSDGAAWWLASKAKTIFPNASWSTSTNIICTADIITNIGYNTLEYNNSQGIALIDPSKIYITNFGQYLFTYSAVVNGGGNNTSISIWLRQSGVDVPRSRTRQVFTSATAQQCMTVNYIVDVRTNNTYFELVAASHDTGAGIVNEGVNPTGYTAPAMPSIIITVNRVSDSYP